MSNFEVTEVTNEKIEKLADLLLKEQQQKELTRRNERFKRTLLLLAKGVVLAIVLTAPKTSSVFKDFLKEGSDWKEWKTFNINYLRRTIKRLEKQKMVEIVKQENSSIIKITKKGQRKVLKYSLNSITIQKPNVWDGKWRLIFYDVIGGKRNVRDKFRSFLKLTGFYQLQESVYLHPYPCEEEIEFFKYYLGIGSEVRIIVAEKIENDQEFRDYFGI